MRNILFSFLAFLTFVASAQQTLDTTLVHNGITREYRLYIPARYTGNVAVPLVFNLHGYTSNNIQQELYGNFRPIADTANFIICHPNGTFDGANNRFWNAGFGGTVDDIGFIMALLDHLETTYNIDPARVYSTGMSNGGFMSFTLACSRADRIAAIASVTGGMTILLRGTCSPSRPVPIMQIHGTADPTVPYAGNAQFLGVDSLISFWENHNGCTGGATVTPVPNTNLTDGCTATRYDYSNCDANSEVVLYKVDGGEHTWPGAAINIGVTNRDFNASLEIWKFFNKHNHPEIVSGISKKQSVKSYNLYPNPFNNQLHFEIENSGNYSLMIYDVSGKTLINQNLNKSGIININDIPQGIYFAVLRNEKGVWVERIMKE
jgi:polyhydroxybutyrate depolymerase